jgi:phosphate transport system permease protein
VSTVALDPPGTSEDDRRALVQASARRFYRRKMLYSKAFLTLTVVALGVACIPLASIVWNILRRGIPQLSWAFLTTPQQLPTLFHQNELGGISNAITGTIITFGIGLLIAIPFSIVTGIALYESRGRFMASFRTLLEVMVGMPSILFGVFIYAYVVTKMHYQLTGWAGALALAVLMIPLMSVSCEVALRSVPTVLVEAALALGAKRASVMRRVVLPYALPRIWTGVMLALSRAVGETAPVLFVIGTSLIPNWNPGSQQTTMTTLMYNDVASPYASQQNQTWGIALVLIFLVFIFNIGSRIIVARSTKGRT